MKSRPLCSCLIIVLGGLAACAGPITTRSGIAGPPVAAASVVALAPAPEGADAASTSAILAAREVVAQALARHGYQIMSEAPLRIEIGLAERGAAVDVRALGGPALSPAKASRPFQSCEDRTHRLTLAVVDPASPPVLSGVTRVWAEEHHCKGTFAASLPHLAEQAVTALKQTGSEVTTTRRGQD